MEGEGWEIKVHYVNIPITFYVVAFKMGAYLVCFVLLCFHILANGCSGDPCSTLARDWNEDQIL